MAGLDDLKTPVATKEPEVVPEVAKEEEEEKHETHFGLKTLSEIKHHLKNGEMALSHFGDDVLKKLNLKKEDK